MSAKPRKPHKRDRAQQRAFKRQQRGSITPQMGMMVMLIALCTITVALMVFETISNSVERDAQRDADIMLCERAGGEAVQRPGDGILCIDQHATVKVPR